MTNRHSTTHKQTDAHTHTHTQRERERETAGEFYRRMSVGRPPQQLMAQRRRLQIMVVAVDARVRSPAGKSIFRGCDIDLYSVHVYMYMYTACHPHHGAAQLPNQ